MSTITAAAALASVGLAPSSTSGAPDPAKFTLTEAVEALPAAVKLYTTVRDDPNRKTGGPLAPVSARLRKVVARIVSEAKVSDSQALEIVGQIASGSVTTANAVKALNKTS